MIKRTIEISGYDTALLMQHRQIEIHREGERIAAIPAEDIGVLIVDTREARYSHGTLVALAQEGAVVVVCDGNHEPVAMITPVAANSTQAQRVRLQAGLPESLRRRLWRTVVRHKIEWQARNIESDTQKKALLQLVPRVQLGDKSNVEARAAKMYWPALFHDINFRRDPEGGPPNGLLNYGYMVLRAALARAICGAGLCVSLGIQHSNKYNSFCLADDFVECFRPLVDRVVRRLVTEGRKDVTKDTKRSLLEILTATVTCEGQQGPLMISMERCIASFVRSLESGDDSLLLPQLWT